MGLRFRKSFKLAPGVRLNISKSGMSWTIGPRGASVSIGKRGTYLNAGVPGTGLSARIPIGGGATPQRPAASEMVTVSLKIEIDDDGVVRYLDAIGRAVPDAFVVQARRQQGTAIRNLLEQKCSEINAQIDSLGELHFETPALAVCSAFAPDPFPGRAPIASMPVKLGWLAMLFPSRRRAAEVENARRNAAYLQSVAYHEREVAAHARLNDQARALYSAAIAGNPEQMEALLEQRLGEIVWPTETLVGIDIAPDGRALMLDVDLPEVEDMPTMRATLGARSWDLSLRAVGEVATRKLYQRHIHAIGFRMIGEAFAALPTLRTIVLSGYSQRASAVTGHVNDEYLYSVRVQRDEWSQLNFLAMRQIDVIAALDSFEMRRNMTVTGIFRPVNALTL